VDGCVTTILSLVGLLHCKTSFLLALEKAQLQNWRVGLVMRAMHDALCLCGVFATASAMVYSVT
jgi:hypothetical protein